MAAKRTKRRKRKKASASTVGGRVAVPTDLWRASSNPTPLTVVLAVLLFDCWAKATRKPAWEDDIGNIPLRLVAARVGCDPDMAARHLRRLGDGWVWSRPDTGSAYVFEPDPEPETATTYVPLSLIDSTHPDHPGLTLTEKAAVVSLSSWSDYGGRLDPNADPSGLASAAGMSLRTFERAVQRLRALGVVVRGRIPPKRWCRNRAAAVALYSDLRYQRRIRVDHRRAGRWGAFCRWGQQIDPRDSAPSSSIQSPESLEEDGLGTPGEVGTRPGPHRRRRRKSAPSPEEYRYKVLSRRKDWVGIDSSQFAQLARSCGRPAAIAAALESDHRQATGRYPIRSPYAHARFLADCYADRCQNPAAHPGPCGHAALVADRARRLDEYEPYPWKRHPNPDQPPTPTAPAPPLPAPPTRRRRCDDCLDRLMAWHRELIATEGRLDPPELHDTCPPAAD